MSSLGRTKRGLVVCGPPWHTYDRHLYKQSQCHGLADKFSGAQCRAQLTEAEEPVLGTAVVIATTDDWLISQYACSSQLFIENGRLQQIEGAGLSSSAIYTDVGLK